MQPVTGPSSGRRCGLEKYNGWARANSLFGPRPTDLSRRGQQPPAGGDAMNSNLEIHPIERDLQAGLFDLAPGGRVFVENRIGVVDVNIDSPFACELRQRGEASVRTRDRQVAHRAGRFVSNALLDHLAVGPASAVEQDAVAVSENAIEPGIDFPDSGDISERAAALYVDESES